MDRKIDQSLDPSVSGRSEEVGTDSDRSHQSVDVSGREQSVDDNYQSVDDHYQSFLSIP